jgi:hypothetical protein
MTLQLLSFQADVYISSKCFGEPLGEVRTRLIEGGFEELFQL